MRGFPPAAARRVVQPADPRFCLRPPQIDHSTGWAYTYSFLDTSHRFWVDMRGAGREGGKAGGTHSLFRVKEARPSKLKAAADVWQMGLRVCHSRAWCMYVLQGLGGTRVQWYHDTTYYKDWVVVIYNDLTRIICPDRRAAPLQC